MSRGFLESLVSVFVLVLLTGCNRYVDKESQPVPGAMATDKLLKGVLEVGSEKMPVVISPKEKRYELSYDGLLFLVSVADGKQIVTVINPESKSYLSAPIRKLESGGASVDVATAFRQDLWGDNPSAGNEKDKLRPLYYVLSQSSRFPDFFVTPCQFSTEFLGRHSECDAESSGTGERHVHHKTTFKKNVDNHFGRPRLTSEKKVQSTTCVYHWDYGLLTSCEVLSGRGKWRLTSLEEVADKDSGFTSLKGYKDMAADSTGWLPAPFGREGMGKGGFKLATRKLDAFPRLPAQTQWRLLREEWNSERGRAWLQVMLPAVAYEPKLMASSLKSYVEENGYNSFLLDYARADWPTLEECLEDEKALKEKDLKFTHKGLFFHLKFTNFGDRSLDIPVLARELAHTNSIPELDDPDPEFLAQELVKFPIADDECFKATRRIKAGKPTYSWFRDDSKSKIRKGRQSWRLFPTNWYHHRVEILAWDASLLETSIDWTELVKAEEWPSFYRNIDWAKSKREADGFQYYELESDHYIVLRGKTMLVVEVVVSPHGSMWDRDKIGMLKKISAFQPET